MQLRGKILGALRRAWTFIVFWADYVIDPPPKAIKWYVLGMLIAVLGGGILLGPLFAPKGSSPVYSLASPPAGIAVSFPPRVRSKDLVPLKTLKPQPPAATVKAADASKDKKKLYRKPKCNTVLC
jgi:hypothetical protein